MPWGTVISYMPNRLYHNFVRGDFKVNTHKQSHYELYVRVKYIHELCSGFGSWFIHSVAESGPIITIFELSSHKLMLMTAACVLGISCRSVLSSQENMAHTRTLYYLVSHQTTVLPCMESIDVGEIIGR